MGRSLPAKIENTTPILTEAELKIADALAAGATPAQVARAIAPENAKQRKAWRQRIRRMALKPEFQQALATGAKAELMLNVGAHVKALNKMAQRRPDAVKLAMEASGFHNPRTEVNHSGEVQITIKGLPRPDRVEDDTEVVDAEVVD